MRAGCTLEVCGGIERWGRAEGIAEVSSARETCCRCLPQEAQRYRVLEMRCTLVKIEALPALNLSGLAFRHGWC